MKTIKIDQLKTKTWTIRYSSVRPLLHILEAIVEGWWRIITY